VKRKFSFLVFILLVSALCQAHEFWLLPIKFHYGPGETARIDFMVGENFTGAYWDLERHAVEQLVVINRSGSEDVTTRIRSTKGNNLTYTFGSVGTHLFTLQSSAAYIESEGEEFTKYLEEDGIENILAHRKKTNAENLKAREFYTRYAKLLVQYGGRTDDTFKKEAGFVIEIIPQKNPYDLKPGDYMTCKLLYNKVPAPHSLMKVWNQTGKRTFLQNMYTEEDGTITFPISNSGSWMVSSVKMKSSERNDADYESMWASLVFGIN